MTGAQRQARWRSRKREAEAAAKPYKPPYGYKRAKEKLIAQGHQFTRVHDALGEENGGTFVDGAYLSTSAVKELAELPPRERLQRIDEARCTSKWAACEAVEA
jgi:hypothetical protein